MQTHLPRDKDDTDAALAVADWSDEELRANGSALLDWLADSAWPVAQELAPILRERAETIIVDIARVLRSGQARLTKNVITLVVADADPLVRQALVPELQLVASRSDAAGAAEAAFEVLTKEQGK